MLLSLRSASATSPDSDSGLFSRSKIFGGKFPRVSSRDAYTVSDRDEHKGDYFSRCRVKGFPTLLAINDRLGLLAFKICRAQDKHSGWRVSVSLSREMELFQKNEGWRRFIMKSR